MHRFGLIVGVVLFGCAGSSGEVGPEGPPGPQGEVGPAGATGPRLLSTSWDAMQSKTIRRGPRVEGCEIREAGDASWSVQSSDFLVLRKTGPTLILNFRWQSHTCDPRTVVLPSEPVSLDSPSRHRASSGTAVQVPTNCCTSTGTRK